MNAQSSKTCKWTQIVSRRKVHALETSNDSKLARVLGLVDLTFIGVGSTLGLGVYVLAGSVACKTAGPAVAISFLIAAVASGLAGICYAEFAARVPKAGSAYTYSYVTIGEFCAFIIGWNLILEYAIGTASVAKGLSLYLDSMMDNVVSSTLRSAFQMNVSFLSPYPDFLAAGLVLLLTVLLAWGVKESSLVNNVFTVVNLVTVICVVVFGSFKANPANWNISKEYAEAHAVNPKEVGVGGFMPFGWAGVMAGAAKCFYGFVGFDVIATTGEEAKNPKKNIPMSIVISLLITFFAYFGIASVLTMMVPYYEQDVNTPLVTAFQKTNMGYLEHVIRFGATSALSASLLGAIFPLPRILYAMSEDGLLFQFLSTVNSRTKTPVIATLLSGSLAAIVSGIFDLEQLMDMMSIGTLVAYTIVTICILLLRYRSETESIKPSTRVIESITGEPLSLTDAFLYKFKVTFNLVNSKCISKQTYSISKIAIYLFSICITFTCIVVNYMAETMINVSVFLLTILITLDIVSFVILARQPQINVPVVFTVPLVPLLPCCSIVMNAYLIVKLDKATWIRFVGWLLIGFIIYISYSINNSVQGKQDKLSLQVKHNNERHNRPINSITTEKMEMKP